MGSTVAAMTNFTTTIQAITHGSDADERLGASIAHGHAPAGIHGGLHGHYCRTMPFPADATPREIIAHLRAA